jgi:pyrimidine operon attenuation protein / uracil phosphoribosyltransferase
MADQQAIVLDADGMRRTLVRIAHEIVEANPQGAIAIVGIHRRGVYLAARLHELVSDFVKSDVPVGDIDIAFYRDDRDDSEQRESPEVHATHLPFDPTEFTVILVDDVLYTGRTARAATEALFDHGRPARVQLAVLVDRGHRAL